mmetsp:Transcript_9383/g.23539  ORF Transcript_9383/g.23539 Transcript_9383/m.23539 type:complete len:494 (-) Transcript_9383:266-1747(-)
MTITSESKPASAEASSASNSSHRASTDESPSYSSPLLVTEKKMDAATIREVLLAVQRHERDRIHSGFNSLNFAAGVLNSMLVAYVFGHYPQHFWLLWAFEALALIPRKIYQDYTASPLCQILYYADYCWIMTFMIIVSLYGLTIDWSTLSSSLGEIQQLVPMTWRKNMYRAILGVGCGPLAGATAAMPFVAVVFHDSKLMTSLFIHLTPALLCYTFRWHADAIIRSWPRLFPTLHDFSDDLEFFPDGKGLVYLPFQGIGSVAGNSYLLYFLWFVPYVSWMCFWGLDLTRTNRRWKGKDGLPLPTSIYDTAYHSIFRDGLNESIGGFFGRSPEESRRQQREGDYKIRDFCVIMCLHALSVWTTTMFVAFSCLSNKLVHAALLWVIVVLTVWRGADQYVYWVTSMSSSALQEEFKEILEEVHILEPDMTDTETDRIIANIQDTADIFREDTDTNTNKEDGNGSSSSSTIRPPRCTSKNDKTHEVDDMVMVDKKYL